MTDASTETRCPACQTVFAVAAEDLARAGGKVRCGDCLQVFDARAHAIGADHPESEPADSVPAPPQASGAGPDDGDDIDDEKFTVTNWFIVDESGELAPGPERDTDDSGAFRFGDDTPPDTLRAELAALTGDDIGDADDDETEVPAQPAGADSETGADTAADAAHGDDVLDDEDWDALLGELDGELEAQLDAIGSAGSAGDAAHDAAEPEPAPDVGPAQEAADSTEDDAVDLQLADDAAPVDLELVDDDDGGKPVDLELVGDDGGEPLDFELVDADTPGSETSVDLDLTRATGAHPAGDANGATPDADTPAGAEGDGDAGDAAAAASDFDAAAIEDMMEAVELLEREAGGDVPEAGDATTTTADGGDAAAALGATADSDDGSDAPARREPHEDAPVPATPEASDRVAGVGEDTINAMADGDRGEVIVLGDDTPEAVPEADVDDASFAESMIISPDLAPAPRRRTGLWSALSIVAVTALLVQVVHAWRGTLVTQPYWQDALPRIYGALGLPLAAEWDITRWCVETSGALASDAALDVESIFSNRGTEPLPPPLLKVRIVDAYSDTLAATLIAPADYFDGARVPDRVPPGRRITAVARLDYSEPRIDGYEVSLCYAGEDGRLRCNTGCPDDDR